MRKEVEEMTEVINNLLYTFSSLTPFGFLRLFLDIYLVWIVVYLLMNLLKLNVRTLQLIKGIVFILLLSSISNILSLTALGQLIGTVTAHPVLILIIIFQPELRGALEQIGINAVKGNDKKDKNTLVDILSESVEYLSKRRIGALVVIEQDVKLDEYLSSATILDSKLSSELLNTIFVPTTPLHDGAVIIRNENLYCAGAYLPLTTREDINKELGTRHRAAIGASEISDGIVLVASEETGTISIARKGRIIKFENINKFKEALKSYIK